MSKVLVWEEVKGAITPGECIYVLYAKIKIVDI